VIEGGRSLGTWLVSARATRQQEFEAGGTKWRVALRNERYQFPGYGIQLIRARQESYQGTAQARSYASRVRIINPSKKEDRETDISMNMPLRYEGLTFYQSSMGQNERGPGAAALKEFLEGRPRAEFVQELEKPGDRFSGLQVVGNPSMIAPYTGCLLVGFGMLWQFLYHLILPVCAILILVPDIFLIWIAIEQWNIFALAVVGVTPFIRGVIAWQVAKGRYLVFTMVLLFVPTMLTVPFAARYWESHGNMLAPVVFAQFAAFLGIAYVVFSERAAKLQPAQP
jgi:hypothetical protein